MIDDINTEVKDVVTEIFGKSKDVSKEEEELVEGLVSKKTYWSESFWKDMWFYFVNNDSLFSMICAHDKNPYSMSNRIIVFFCILSASMFLSVMLMKSNNNLKPDCCTEFNSTTTDCIDYNQNCLHNLDIDLQNNNLIYSTIISMWDTIMDYIILWYYSCRLKNQLLFCCFSCQKNCCLGFNICVSLGFIIPSIVILFQQKILISEWIINFLIVFLASYIYQGIFAMVIIFPFKRWYEKKNAKNKEMKQLHSRAKPTSRRLANKI